MVLVVERLVGRGDGDVGDGDEGDIVAREPLVGAGELLEGAAVVRGGPEMNKQLGPPCHHDAEDWWN